MLGHSRPDVTEATLRRMRVAAKKARLYAEKSGEQHRSYYVGAAVYARNAAGHTKVFAGCNSKKDKKAAVLKFCAEPTAIMSAIAAGYLTILAVVVVGKPEPDTHGHVDRTLHPCWFCKKFFRDHSHNCPSSMLIVCEWEGKQERFSLEELLKPVVRRRKTNRHSRARSTSKKNP